uniref:Lipoprotein n=1 Tax=Candidatus Nitrotoga fabula TaxID=2182327 RepID=A0A2X0QX90_9PROT|nr:protein of unknown function [Candidatus Nitrotoga fabula]
MMHRSIVLPIAACMILAGCAGIKEPIGAKYTPTTNVGAFVLEDLKAAKTNLDQAVQVGALRYDDPARKCLTAALGRFGTEDQESFEPAIKGAMSFMTVPYIRGQQLASRPPVSDECKQLIGDLMVKGLSI